MIRNYPHGWRGNTTDKLPTNIKPITPSFIRGVLSGYAQDRTWPRILLTRRRAGRGRDNDDCERRLNWSSFRACRAGLSLSTAFQRRTPFERRSTAGTSLARSRWACLAIRLRGRQRRAGAGRDVFRETVARAAPGPLVLYCRNSDE